MSQIIRIVSLSPGEAPQWVRESYIGLELAVSEKLTPQSGKVIGDLGGEPSPDNLDCYVVDIEEFLAKLRRSKPSAANWYQENVPSLNLGTKLLGEFLTQQNVLGFVIGKKFCEVIEG